MRQEQQNRFVYIDDALDDRLFVLEIERVTIQDSGPRDGSLGVISTHLAAHPISPTTKWSVTTRKNTRRFPPTRTDTFDTRAEALNYYKKVVVETPRKSLGYCSPQRPPDLNEYSLWLRRKDFYDPILNPGGTCLDRNDWAGKGYLRVIAESDYRRGTESLK